MQVVLVQVYFAQHVLQEHICIFRAELLVETVAVTAGDYFGGFVVFIYYGRSLFLDGDVHYLVGSPSGRVNKFA